MAVIFIVVSVIVDVVFVDLWIPWLSRRRSVRCITVLDSDFRGPMFKTHRRTMSFFFPLSSKIYSVLLHSVYLGDNYVVCQVVFVKEKLQHAKQANVTSRVLCVY